MSYEISVLVRSRSDNIGAQLHARAKRPIFVTFNVFTALLAASYYVVEGPFGNFCIVIIIIIISIWSQKPYVYIYNHTYYTYLYHFRW